LEFLSSLPAWDLKVSAPYTPRNCSNIPFWGFSLNSCFLDANIEGAALGQGHAVSQWQSWEHNPDFLTPSPIP
jgi:hypothetical protein